MKKRMMFAGAAALVLVFSNTAFAKNNEKVRFYNFEFQLIEGVPKIPDITYETGQRKIQHTRLLNLKKSFMPALLESSKDKAL